MTGALIVAMMAILVAGASLAYFTDTETATNTFTMGGVKIQLIEQERNADGDALQAFTNSKTLMPINGSAQGATNKDKFGLQLAGNYVDKIITVKNLDSDAYVRVYYAVPTALDNTTNDGLDILHLNLGNRFMPNGDYDASTNNTNSDWTANMGSEQYVGTATINEISYNVYYQTYKKALAKDEVTGSAFLVGLYLDKNVDNRYDEETQKTVYTITRGGVTSDIDFDFSNGVTIPVFAVGVQADGFTADGTTSAADVALNTALGANYNPWN